MRAGRGGLAGLVLIDLAALAACAVLLALGTWQVQRRAWKLDLIGRVEARLRAEPGPPPRREDWPGLTEADAYRRVRLTGTPLSGRDTLVQAVTALGGGYWVMSPLDTPEGLVLVNRGFVPTERRDPAARRPASGTVTGLIRLTEPGGGFLRANDPAADRWYSRDTAAIARARGLAGAAPYFVDAETGEGASAAGLPVAGLTVVSFPNNHLVYALTWYALALMVAGGAAYATLDTLRARRTRPVRQTT